MKTSSRAFGPQQGFTLIELMIVVAIIGVLAAIAIPAFQDYAVKARATEALGFASSAKVAVSENAIAGLVNLASGIEPVAATGNVASMTVDATTGVIVVTTTARAGGGDIAFVPTSIPAVSGGVRPQPSDRITWSCNGPLTTLDIRYKPNECR